MKRTTIFLSAFLSLCLSLSCVACSPTNENSPPLKEEDAANPVLPDFSENEPPMSEDSTKNDEQEGDEPKQDVPPMPEVTPPETEEKPSPPAEETPPVSETNYIKILTNGLNVRAAASTNSAVRGQVNRNERLLLLGKENGFYKTVYRGTVAFVSASTQYAVLETITSADDKIERVIEEGTRLIGTPYIYGAVRYHDGAGRKLSGFTTARFDCSSLMQYIFYTGANELLQVNTRTQVFQGVFVERKNLQRGDLIFFTNAARKNKSGVERIGHVGLYLGDNLLLHTASDYCKIEPIDSLRWSYYEQARRIL